LSPGHLAGLTLKNKIVMPAMGTNYGNPDGTVSQRLIDYYVARAKGGFGLIVVEVAAVAPLGKAVGNETGIWFADLGSSIAKPIDLIDARRGLLAPVFDKSNRLWLTASGTKSDLLTYNQSGEKRKIESTWLGSIKRKSIAISPEGSRFAVLEQRKAGNRLLVSVIVRDETGDPISLGDPIEVSLNDATVEAFSWADSTHLAVIAKNATGVRPRVIELGGSSRTLPSINGVTKILASNPLTAIYVLTSNQEVLQLRGSTWDVISTGQTAMAFGH
jgi:hypothetical protein